MESVLETHVIIDGEKLNAFMAKDSFDIGQRTALAKTESVVQFEHGRRSAWRTLETELPNLQWEPKLGSLELYTPPEPGMPKWVWCYLAVFMLGSTLQIIAAFMKLCHPR